jgi:DNA-directed RNA polymerase beta' subunit
MASLDEEWEAYKTTFKKTYSAEEDERRKQIYIETKKRVEEHNEKFEKGETTFTMGINQFSDQLPEEMSCCGVRKPKKDGDATAEV